MPAESEAQKQCRTCKESKPVTSFQAFRGDRPRSNPRRKLYYASDCKPCRSEWFRKRKYGVTLREMVEKQASSSCPLCQSAKAACIDHDHITGKPRGALCQPCNRVLHYIEDQEWMNRARGYLCQQ